MPKNNQTYSAISTKREANKELDSKIGPFGKENFKKQHKSSEK